MSPEPRCPPQVGTISEAYPHLILDNLSSKLGQRTANILKHLFPVPKVRSVFADTPRACNAAGCLVRQG